MFFRYGRLGHAEIPQYLGEKSAIPATPTATAPAKKQNT